MPGALGETLQVIGGGERDHRDPAVPALDLLVELPQLREMLLAEESTEVAKQDQNGRPAKQFVSVEDPAIDRHQVEVEIDPHRTMMRPLERQPAESRAVMRIGRGSIWRDGWGTNNSQTLGLSDSGHWNGHTSAADWRARPQQTKRERSDPIRADSSARRQSIGDRIEGGRGLRQQPIQPFQHQPIDHLLAPTLAGDETAVAKTGQVGADPRLWLRDGRNQLADAALPARQELEYPQPGGIPEHAEEAGGGTDFDWDHKTGIHIWQTGYHGWIQT